MQNTRKYLLAGGILGGTIYALAGSGLVPITSLNNILYLPFAFIPQVEILPIGIVAGIVLGALIGLIFSFASNHSSSEVGGGVSSISKALNTLFSFLYLITFIFSAWYMLRTFIEMIMRPKVYYGELWMSVIFGLLYWAALLFSAFMHYRFRNLPPTRRLKVFLSVTTCAFLILFGIVMAAFSIRDCSDCGLGLLPPLLLFVVLWIISFFAGMSVLKIPQVND